MRNLYFLRIDNDTLDEAKPFHTRRGAVAHFRIVASELARYGQKCSATVHRGVTRIHLDEYPDWVLHLGPRGGVQVTAA